MGTELSEKGGLADASQIEALADQLSACADDLHARIMQDINSRNGKPMSEAQQNLARKLLDDEQLLRQHANGLYADAATLVVGSLGKSQQHVLELTMAAGEKIRKIAMIGNVTNLVAGLLGLAAAVGTGNVPIIVKALEGVRKGVKAVNAVRAKK